MMRTGVPAALALLLLGGLSACATRPDRPLLRKPLAHAASSGWARLPLDRDTQAAFPDLWLSDGQGRPVPFLVERDGLWQPRELDLEHLLLGRDDRGRSTAEFVLKFPQGWQVRQREQLRIALEVEGSAPWVCRVEVARRLAGGAGIALERDIPLHVFDLGEAGRQLGFSVPWDFQICRVTLDPIQGAAPRLKGLRVSAVTEPSARQDHMTVAPRVEPAVPGTWRLGLDASDRVTGADITLQPPVAPVTPTFLRTVAPERDPASARERHVASSGLLWNLPALASAQTRVSLEPVTTDHLLLRLPEGAVPTAVTLQVRREVLLFPAEAGVRYFLHWGGQVRQAPGSLAALPDTSRDVYKRDPLGLGPAEPDPHGTALDTPPLEAAKPWLPWIAGLAVVALGLLAARLFRK